MAKTNPAMALSRVTAFTLDLVPEDIPLPAREMAALLLLDTLGVCAASAPMEAGVLGRETAAMLHAAGNPAMAARMLFDGRPVSIAGAAYAGATQIDNLDWHDGYNPTKGHIGVAVVPALAAVAEHLPDLDGRDALAALIVGYEVAGRAGIAHQPTTTHRSASCSTASAAGPCAA